jgi:ATP-binding cassette subfamily F protein uup
MDKIVDHLFIFKGEGIIEDFPGNYSDYREYESSIVKEKIEVEKKKKPKKQSISNNAIKQAERNLKKVESEIKQLNSEKKRIENIFNNTNVSIDEIEKLSKQLQEIIIQLEEKEEYWLELSMLLD